MKKITLSILALLSVILVNAQSDCANAQVISVGADASTTVSVTSVNGTAATSPCLTHTTTTAQSGVWYSYTGTQDLMVTVTSNTVAASTDYFATMSLMSGTCSALVCEDTDYVGSNGNSTNPNLFAEIEFFAAANTTYYIYFDDLYFQQGNGGTGPFDFTVSTSSTLPTVPGPASNPTPANGATDVAIGTAASGESSVDFAWDAPTTGDAADSYTIVISTDQTFQDTNVTISGTLSSTTASGLYLPGSNYFTEGTTYYWMVIPENGGGSTDMSNISVWSFTTESNLGAEDFENNTLTHYTNNGMLFIDAQTKLQNVEIYSILGKKVANENLNGTEASINIAHLQNGVYLAKVKAEGQVKTFKFIKK